MTRKKLSGAVALLVVAVSYVANASTTSTPMFNAPVRVTGSSGYEPGIDISRGTGTVFVNDPSGSVRSQTFRSDDGGVTWAKPTVPAPYNRLPGGFDQDVAISHDGGSVYSLDLSVVSNTLLRSDDDGKTWNAGTPFSTLALSDREWVAVGRRDPVTKLETVYAAYALIQPPSQVMLARSKDSGITWDFHTPIPALQQSAGFTGQLVANDQGFVAVSYVRDDRVMVARSHDEGVTWKTGPVGRVEGIPVRGVFRTIQGLAIDGNNLHVVWTDKAFTVRYAHSPDLGETWNDMVEIAQGSNVFPWVAARDGKVGVAWYGSNAPPQTNPNNVAPNGSWFTYYAESTDNGATFSAPVNVSGDYVKKGPICTNGLACQSGRELGDFLMLDIDARGASLVAYGSTRCGCTQVAKQIVS